MMGTKVDGSRTCVTGEQEILFGGWQRAPGRPVELGVSMEFLDGAFLEAWDSGRRTKIGTWSRILHSPCAARAAKTTQHRGST